MYSANPMQAFDLADPGLMVLVLGVILVIVGIVISGVVYREAREWRKLILPLFERRSMEDDDEDELDLPEGSIRLTPRQADLGRQIFARVFNHMDVAGLLGGGATVVVGILVVLVGLALYG